MSLLRKGALALVGLMFVGSFAQADTLSLPGGLRPDIDTTYVLAASYDGTTLSVVDAFPGYDQFNLADSSNNDHSIYDASYTLTASFDASHNYVTNSGTLTISGLFNDGFEGMGPLTLLPVTLLTATITNVGFASGSPGATSGNVINFEFNNISGVLQNIYGTKGGITLTVVDANITPTFAAPFYDSGASVSDNFAMVPTPAALSGGIALLGGLALAGVRRRRHLS